MYNKPRYIGTDQFRYAPCTAITPSWAYNVSDKTYGYGPFGRNWAAATGHMSSLAI
jgi:hypothetical protein